jgi:hypothetical protein
MNRLRQFRDPLRFIEPTASSAKPVASVRPFSKGEAHIARQQAIIARLSGDNRDNYAKEAERVA